MLSLKPKRAPAPLTTMLLASALLLTGCAHDSPLAPPTDGPLIPPLPAQAHQPVTPLACLPTCSGALSKLLDSMQASPTPAAPPAKPANSPTKR